MAPQKDNMGCAMEPCILAIATVIQQVGELLVRALLMGSCGDSVYGC